MRPLQEFIEAEWRMYADNSCRLIATKPSSDEMVVYCSLVPYFSEIWIKIQNFFIKENAFENVVCKMSATLSGPRCLKLSPYHAIISLEHIWRSGSRRWDGYITADFRFAPNRWETALLCNDVSHVAGCKPSITPVVQILGLHLNCIDLTGMGGYTFTILVSVHQVAYYALKTLLASADWRTPSWWLLTHLRQLSTRPSAANKLNWLKL